MAERFSSPTRGSPGPSHQSAETATPVTTSLPPATFPTQTPEPFEAGSR